MEILTMSRAQLHQDVAVEKSATGGYGLFFNGQLQNNHNEDIILLRIPSSSVYDMDLLLQRLENWKTTNKSLADDIVLTLTAYRPRSESEIIFCYFVALLSSQDKTIAAYTQVLTTTDVSDIDAYTGDYTDAFITSLKEQKQLLEQKYAEVKSGLSNPPTFETFFHLHQAVRSRVLEIPHEIEDNDTDFTTSVALVPVLDFVNHSHNKNAYFDVDRTTKDVLLKLDLSVVQKEKFEVFISYSSPEAVQNFVSSYGFIPQVLSEQLFEYRIENMAALGDLQFVAKWLGVVPNFRIVNSEDSARICLYDPDSTTFSVLFTPGLSYDRNWKYNGDLAEAEAKETIIEMVEFQEQHCDTVDDMPLIAVLKNGHILDESLEVTPELQENAVKFIVDSMREDVEKLQSEDTTVVGDYVRYKKEVLNKAIKQYDNGEDVVLKEEELEEYEWIFEYPLRVKSS